MWKLMDLKQNGIFLLAALVGSAGAIAADKVYISVDESGQPVASDRAPATGTVEEVVATPKAPQSDATKAQRRRMGKAQRAHLSRHSQSISRKSTGISRPQSGA